MSYIGAALRGLVIERAGNCCEYCRLSQAENPFSFHVEHIISEKYDGATDVENLCLSCPECNAYKGSDIGSNDPQTGELARLYNPRTQNWNDHFRFDPQTYTIEPLTSEGRVTVFLLRLNSAEQIASRRLMVRFGLYPC